MKGPLFLFLLVMSIPAAAQNANAIYHQACGPKDAKFVVEQVMAFGTADRDEALFLIASDPQSVSRPMR